MTWRLAPPTCERCDLFFVLFKTVKDTVNLIFLKDFPILEVAKFLFFILDGEGGYNQLLKKIFEIRVWWRCDWQSYISTLLHC